jgi:hypothetical protein
VTDDPPERATEQFKDPTTQTVLVELRSTGGQTLVSPSINPDGLHYRWDERGQPARVATDTLRRTVRDVAATALLARHWPGEGGRHGFALALSGYLLHGGMSEAAAARLMDAAARAAGDDEAADRIAAVHSTAERLRMGELVQGGPTLADSLDSRILDALRAWLDLRGSTPASRPPQERPIEGGKEKESQSSALIRLSEADYTFHMSDGGEPFAVAREGPPIARMLRGGRDSLRAVLAARYAAAHDRAPSACALADAMLVIEGRCLTATRVTLALRLAQTPDAIVLDLGRADGQCVTISAGGWSIGPTPPGIIWRRT